MLFQKISICHPQEGLKCPGVWLGVGLGGGGGEMSGGFTASDCEEGIF